MVQSSPALIILVISAVAVFSVVMAAPTSVVKAKSQCSIFHSQFIEVEIRRLPTPDKISMLKIGSYLSYPDEKGKYGFMNTLLVKAGSKKLDSGATEFFIDLSCANLTMTVLDNGSSVNVEKASLQLQHPNWGQTSCELSGLSDLSVKSGSHYECFNERIYHCQHDGATIVEFIVESLEFELQGDPAAHLAGNFSTNPQHCKN